MYPRAYASASAISEVIPFVRVGNVDVFCRSERFVKIPSGIKLIWTLE